MASKKCYFWMIALLMSAVVVLPTRTSAHPGSGIVIDKEGQIYFVDMISGVWKVDNHGILTHLAGPAFHWMTYDALNCFRAARLPSGSGGEISRIDSNPSLVMASDYPIVMGPDSNLYYPSHDRSSPLQMLRMSASGKTSVVATLPPGKGINPVRDLNDLVMSPDGSLIYTENDAIRRISKEGIVSTVTQNVTVTSCASVPGLGEELGPLFRGLDIDSSGSIYVAATGCRSVLKVTPTGDIARILQVQPPWAPTGVVVSGNIVYVLEFQGAGSDNRREMIPRVRKISPNGNSVIIASVTRGN